MARFETGSGRQLSHAMGLVTVKALLLLVGLGLARAWLGEGLWEAGGLAFLAVGAVMALDVLGVVGLGLVSLGRLTPEALGWRWNGALDVLWGVSGGLFVVVGLLALVGLWFGPEAALGTGRALLDWTPQQRLLFALIGLGAALGEETLFRGYLQPGLQRRLGPGLGLLLTAVIFALYHLQPHPVALLGKLWVGLVCGALRDATGRLWAPGVAHGVVWCVMGAA